MEKGEGKEFNFQDQDIYKDGLSYIQAIYSITKTYPKDELYGLVTQFRRAAVSVVLNFVEGWGRFNQKEKAQFYKTGRASLLECVAILDISKRQGYLSDFDHAKILNSSLTLSKKINGLIKRIEK